MERKTTGRAARQKRNGNIVKMRLRGVRCAKIAAKYGITVGRVSQICTEAGISPYWKKKP